MEFIYREEKKRRESIELFVKGGRADLSDAEQKELKIVEAYLPAQMGEAEIKEVIRKTAEKTGEAEFGLLMKEVMKELKGKADGSAVSRLIKEHLGS